ncbi:hypothetical protein HMPREF9098_0058 [Kingella denitrificans ATCC 33394]|uniref:Uncharacterized protein n=1 Tax=Kingella denitrificans ATCC 33394 TaxID=888741 RepID=F0EW24_9NEIS|nr:hypothetical protein HMPREF9098_0058 [Kingella denitrificans ATCC 33394]
MTKTNILRHFVKVQAAFIIGQKAACTFIIVSCDNRQYYR